MTDHENRKGAVFMQHLLLWVLTATAERDLVLIQAYDSQHSENRELTKDKL